VSKTTPENQAPCAVCTQRRAGGAELYEIREGDDRYLFNVGKAKKIAADGRMALTLPPEILQELVAINEYEPPHLRHVDPGRPGVVLLCMGGLVLVDGVHRGTRCLREKREFRVRALTYLESQRCLVRQEIAGEDAAAIVRKLRRLMAGGPTAAIVKAELACPAETLREVQALLTPEEGRRLRLRAMAGRGGPPGLGGRGGPS
jgi:hypothetical protein